MDGPVLMQRRGARVLLAVLLVAVCATSLGCALRRFERRGLLPRHGLMARPGWFRPQPVPLGERTRQFLRQHDLENSLDDPPRMLLEKVQAVVDREPSLEGLYAYAEVSFALARRLERTEPRLALDLYGGTVLRAYQYLFDPRFDSTRNAYDPHFRGACDLYNAALESALRIVCKGEQLRPGTEFQVRTADAVWRLKCIICDERWRPEDFGRFEFVSDYRIIGLRNHHVSFGLGVPLIAVRKSYPGEPPAARYYPPDLSFPVTVFLRPEFPNFDASPKSSREERHYEAQLELYDPVATSDVNVNGKQVPLQADLTTPLAAFLSNPAFGPSLATVGLLRPETLLTLQPGRDKPLTGLYMVQPYEPQKIPVVFIHGWWSSPMTWMQMFNDLRSIPEIRHNYQFWFYLYPTGQPFWISAAQFRRELRELRQTIDPQHVQPALDQMILVGHSMGGLIAEMQVMESGDEFWRLVSDHPFSEVRADPETLAELREIFFFHPNPSVRRIITLATPHWGSHFSNGMTQRLAAQLIRVPQQLLQTQERFFRENAELLIPDNLLKITDSVDALAPECPIFPVLNNAPRASWVLHHNIVGVSLDGGLWGRVTGTTDGVLSWESAHSDRANSELAVPAEHTTIHTHPLAILEVKRILLEHLDEVRQEERLMQTREAREDLLPTPAPIRLPPVDPPAPPPEPSRRFPVLRLSEEPGIGYSAPIR
ncbi:hypothetical protein THTE_0174 [Thermogutta terrifontis]|uniref:AB hydrolase-1 domain-containing protein n=2 Tax=Thermogutta terrifontis TaxID=1331910 RepID=A0A286R9Z3_9BACT|nr:hypothetical protein THTE_0174 [Thermogutta terrifontis]